MLYYLVLHYVQLYIVFLLTLHYGYFCSHHHLFFSYLLKAATHIYRWRWKSWWSDIKHALNLDSSVENCIIVQWYNHGNPHFQEGIKLCYMLLHFIYPLKILYLKELVLIIMEALTNPEIIRHLWISGPFEKSKFLISSIQRVFPMDNISGFLVFFLGWVSNAQPELMSLVWFG